MSNLKDTGNGQLPQLIQLADLPADEFVSYFRHHRGEIAEKLLTSGAVKFTGVEISSLDTFQHIVNSISTRFLSYIDGNSPRTKLSENVYTSTEYDNAMKITMHNELSYSARWPGQLFFSCIQPAATAGETLLADSRRIVEVMNKDIVSEVSAKGVRYVRNLQGGMGIGPTWQETFETEDPAQAEAYCRSYNIAFEWGDNNSLRLKQFSKGIIHHRHSGELLWFNQIDQFHPFHLGEDLYEAMVAAYGDPSDFPTYVTFGDGSPVSDDMVQEILTTIDSVTIAPAWRKNELLIVDNEMVCHGRNPFTGERRVLVAMSE
ncbi:Taurine catabolism dioxygenase TauD, TfdA family [Chitinophaga eiseniae]|uniref:Taurine catabolism dioxygenase TauD, TfdA family n=1 Tax=Chitinophaga eiseniae TaxID=634771 RepID=A0A1T4U6N8_9BACT|nr:TauD/TfdA family dioxygenase [Chitinophaga eiseniae]SKA48306.1 Taurine catabolism dioxygenase TauD, TfdA family [Chitinophaga eiseniae]